MRISRLDNPVPNPVGLVEHVTKGNSKQSGQKTDQHRARNLAAPLLVGP
jgi:hypothetical protein